MDTSTTPTYEPYEIPRSDVTVFEGHTSEVKYFINVFFICKLFTLAFIYFSSVKLFINGPFHCTIRCVLVHGVLQDLF